MKNVIRNSQVAASVLTPHVGTYGQNILAVASRAALAQGASTCYLEHVAEGWNLDEQRSRLNTAALLLGFADLVPTWQQRPLVAALPALGAPAEVSYSQAC